MTWSGMTIGDQVPYGFSGTATVRTVHGTDPLREVAADLLDEARVQIKKDADTIEGLEQRITAAGNAFSRIESEYGITLTRLERNRAYGMPDDWLPLSRRYPERFPGQAARQEKQEHDSLPRRLDRANAQIERLNSELAGVRESLSNESEARDDWQATAATHAAELAKLRAMNEAALTAFNRIENEYGYILTELEKNRICGISDDWKPLSARYPDKFPRTAERKAKREHDALPAQLSRANDALERSLAEKETLRHQLDAARAVADLVADAIANDDGTDADLDALVAASFAAVAHYRATS